MVKETRGYGIVSYVFFFFLKEVVVRKKRRKVSNTYL